MDYEVMFKTMQQFLSGILTFLDKLKTSFTHADQIIQYIKN